MDYAIISHAHSDHARPGMKHYLCHHFTKPIIQHRLGAKISVESVAYGEKRIINGVTVSLHPAGHLIGSAQIRMEYKGQVMVFTGDYKTGEDGLSTPFESVKCHGFITESTFGLPIYKWKSNQTLTEELQSWIHRNQTQGKTSILVGYSLGKAQRILSMVAGVGEIYSHSAIQRTNAAIEKAGVELPKTKLWTAENSKEVANKILIVPPALLDSKMIKRIPNGVTAICSGWMQVRGKRRWRAADAGFAISDHADWDGLLHAVKASEAEHVYVTHGSQAVFAKYLNEIGIPAEELKTEYGEQEEEEKKELVNKES